MSGAYIFQINASKLGGVPKQPMREAKVDALGAPDRFKAEQFLKDTLGVEVYS